MRYDVLIIGAGPIGLACAIEAKRNGLTYKVIEKGCLVNSIFNYPVNMTFFSTSERLEIGEVPFISHGTKPTRSEALEYYRRVAESWKLDINLYERVSGVSGTIGNFTVSSDRGVYASKIVIVSTGFFDFPNLMNIPGEELPKVKHYYDDPHLYANMDIVVIGGGNSAVDVALETFRKGARVTMVVKNPEIDKGVKYWVRPDIENRIKDGSIISYFNSSVVEIKPESVIISTPDGEKEIKNDFVLAMTGYRPDYDFLTQIGIATLDPVTMEPQYDNTTFQTNIPGIFLAGVVCCGQETRKWFIENSRYHATNIFEYIKGIL
ncbi:MAG: YpdA family putative bacillithiol disulfide reductase [Ignavibacteria bacterium]|nr:YpdA family putative bacillithiol disulfide reductase [Ignavibacteria bacterium]